MKAQKVIAYLVQSETNPKTKYKVSLKKCGRGHHALWCDCLAYRYSKGRKDCKHIKFVKELIRSQA